MTISFIQTNITLSPLVATSILDSISRDTNQGILLGKDSTCATYSYPTLDETLVETLLKSHKINFPLDKIIGIYTDSTSLIVPEFLFSLCSCPILIQVFESDLNWKGYQIQRLDTSQIAYPIQVHKRVVHELERQALASIAFGLEKEPNLKQQLSLQLENISKLQSYVENVLNGKIPKDPKLGRVLLNALSIHPLDELEEKTKVKTRDSNLLLKTTQLTMQQLANSEKISTSKSLLA